MKFGPREPSLRQAWFMPWAGIDQELQIGPVTFWSFSKKANKMISEQSVRDHLERYFHRYVDHQGKSVKTITVCSHSSTTFRELQKNKANELRTAVDALIFSVICPATVSAVATDNRIVRPASADRYQLGRYDFLQNDEYVAIQAGNALHSGLKIDKIIFPQPWYTGGAFRRPHDVIAAGFSKAFEGNFPADI